MKLEVLHFPNPFLRKKAEKYEISSIDREKLRQFIRDMQETMYSSNGVGLAAPQVGVSKSLFIIDLDQKVERDEDGGIISHQAGNLMVFINPVILSGEGSIKSEEGCLSVPGVYEDVKRFKKVEVTYFDENLEECRIVAEDMMAIAIQHENDHLDGKLFIDLLPTVKKTVIKNKFLKGKTL
ncbi:MAG: peptide deformylase [Oligoflexia bacterium]|nr:peptide deformylase [Oligoflexia bacterium]